MREAESRAQVARREVWRHAVVEAAIRLFARDGYEATSMHAVAKEAGVSLRALYEVFPGKDGLFTGVLDEVFDRNRLVLTGSAGIRQMVLDLFDFLADNPDICLLYARAKHRDPLAAYAAEAEEQIATVARRSDCRVRPELLAQSLLATMLAVVLDAIATGKDLRVVAPEVAALYEPHVR